MITLYAHGSPNPHKVSIALEELALPYETKIIDVWKGEQFSPEFVALSPNSKVPVIVDHDTRMTIYESNAILIYLADKARLLLPQDLKQRSLAMQLLFLQASSIGPMFGQRAHFSLFAPEKPNYAVNRYVAEADRLTGVMEKLLDGRDYFLDEFSIVDIAFFGWQWTAVHQGFDLVRYPNLASWYERVSSRPAVKRGVLIPLPLPDFSPYLQAKTPD
jgi:GSH-dependent disulfide-bond oxidoreductase